jgi:superfamily II DNA helicase RecQ
LIHIEEGCHPVTLATAQCLAAIFFDECHVCITQDFRPAMHKIKALLTAVPVAKYFLTATLPPVLEASFKAKLVLPAYGTGILRAATNRSAMRYMVQFVCGGTGLGSAATLALMQAAKELVLSHPAGAIMIICPTQAEATAAAGHFGRACICSSMNPTTKAETLAGWLSCSSTEQNDSFRNLAGTTAIGTGINPANVVLVIHLGGAYDLMSYAQESGRGGRGRGGQPSTVLQI